MDFEIFKSKILFNLGYEASSSQSNAINILADFFADTNNYCVCLLTGYAGTGKTTLISALIKLLNELKINTIQLAPTGRAAKVLSFYSGYNAYTIHKSIYRKTKIDLSENKFEINYNKNKDTIFIVDEASMIGDNLNINSDFGSGRLLDDLLNFVFSGNNCRLIFVGDLAQLPPISVLLSPALDANYLKSLDLSLHICSLDDVVRQELASGILINANIIRNAINNIDSIYFPKLKLNYPDIISIFSENIIDEIDSAYSKFGVSETKIICKTNKTANVYNNGIRNRILWKENEIERGDLLMVVKNNYSILPKESEIDFIANGDIVEIVKINKIQEIYNSRFADVVIQFSDFSDLEINVKIALDALSADIANLNNDFYKKLYEQLYSDYKYLGTKKKINEAIFSDPYFNALQVKFAYAITCHKAQGGQWSVVFIDHEWLNLEKITAEIRFEFFRWLYTAFTRAKEKIYLINFNPIFFK